MMLDFQITPLMPALWMLVAAPLLLLLPQGFLRKSYMLILPIIGLVLLWLAPDGIAGQIELFGHKLELARLDSLSRIFAAMFLLGAFFAMLFAWRLRDGLEQFSATMYAGAAIAACFAADLISFFIFWEITSLASVLIILAARTQAAYRASFRYFMMQMISGLLLLTGIVLYAPFYQSIAFNALDPNNAAGLLILAAFAVKAAFPLLHYWLADAYPEATPTGTVFLSIFTTKLAIYALLRGFAGFEPLIYIGAAMALYPALYAMIENDLRRVLAYSLNSQLGFMVAGIGIGSKLALNGAIAHAFCSVFYHALLFMAVGAVLIHAGTAKAHQLGGLAKAMPWTMLLCIVGAASIAGLPLFSGFVSKSLTVSASLTAGYPFVWLSLLGANIAVLYHTSMRIPYAIFFAEAKTTLAEKAKEAPVSMRAAMIGLAFFCVLFGIYPDSLYQLLPYRLTYQPYSYDHVITQLELLLFASLAVILLMGAGFQAKVGINLDFDWFARALPYYIRNQYQQSFVQMKRRLFLLKRSLYALGLDMLHALFQKNGWFAAERPSGFMALWIAILLTIAMLFVYN